MSLEDLARAWVSSHPPTTPEGRVERVTLDVSAEGTTEMVTVAERDGRLVIGATSAESPHVQTALRWIARERGAGAVEVAPRQSLLPGAARTVAPAAVTGIVDKERLSTALEDLITAIVRGGVTTGLKSPSITENLDRIVQVLGPAPACGAARWIGRLRGAFARQDVSRVAHLLEGAGRLRDDLSSTSITFAERQRIVGWLGPMTPSDRHASHDRVLLEIAREWASGLERATLERRYLFDVSSGEIVREERVRGSQGISVGPCPRVVRAGLLELEVGPSPMRARVGQYEVTATVSPENLSAIKSHAVANFASLAETYRRQVEQFPGMAEPVALVAPRQVLRQDGSVALLDRDGDPLPLARAEEPALVATIDNILGNTVPPWVFGRLVDADRTLMMVPLSVGLTVQQATVVRRIA